MRSTFFVLGLALSVPVNLLAGVANPAEETTRIEPVSDESLRRLAIAAAEAFEFNPPVTAGGSLAFAIPIEGANETVELEPISIRSPEYRLIVQLADGSYAESTPSVERSYRGTIAGIPGAVVAASIIDDGLHGVVVMPDGLRHWIEPDPAAVAAADAPRRHLVYRDDDVLPGGGTCLTAERAMKDRRPRVASGGVAAEGLHFAELAIDADYEYFTRYGSVAAVEGRVVSIINAMNVQYERDLAIRHIITAMIVRTAEPDPYSSTDPNTLLNQLRTHWNTYQTSIRRDMTQLVTGKNLNGTVIGIAWMTEICSGYAYSLVESDCVVCSAFATKTDLSAHELGHNWNADHCPCSTPYPGYTMNATITSSNRFHPTYDFPAMTFYRDFLTQVCIDVGDDLRRLIVNVPVASLNKGESVQLTATADFQYGPDQDVTAQTVWSVDRPDLAEVSPTGLLTALDADGESCVRVDASYAYRDTTRAVQKQLTLYDPADPLMIVASDPPDGAIDARRPTDANGLNPLGWSSVILTLNGEPCSLSASRFEVVTQGGLLSPPAIVSVTPLGGNAVRVTLDRAVEPGAWTVVLDTVSGIGVRVGFLPGDVNGDGVAGPSDILSLIDALNGVGSALPDWSTDIDRSGVSAPADILSLIDLLNGAGGFSAWNGTKLP